MTDRENDSIIHEAQARLDLEPLANKMSFSSDLLREETLGYAARTLAQRRAAGKKPKLQSHLNWAVAEAANKAGNKNRSDSADVDERVSKSELPDLTGSGLVQLNTAAWLKRRYAKIRGFAWDEGQSAALRQMRATATMDGRHRVEKQAVATAKKLRDAVLELRRLAEGDEGGIVWSLLVNKIEPQLTTEAFDILVETTESELDGVAVDEANTGAVRARFAVTYIKHRALALWFDEHLEEHAIWAQPHTQETRPGPRLTPEALERALQVVKQKEVAIAWLLGGLREDERQGVTVPIEWDGWSSTDDGNPGSILKREEDNNWKGARGPWAQARTTLKELHAALTKKVGGQISSS